MAEKLALKPAEAAQLLGVSMPIMYALCNRRDFPSVRVGRSWLIPAALLQGWLEAHADGVDVLEGRAV